MIGRGMRGGSACFSRGDRVQGHGDEDGRRRVGAVEEAYDRPQGGRREMHQMLTLTLAPAVPASLRNIPTKYNLIIRLWTHAFHRLLESLRRVATPPNDSPIALEYLQDFIYYSYTFYCGLLKERNLFDFRSTWVEALGDLARYRMATCTLLDNMQAVSNSITPFGVAPLLNAHLSAPQPVDPEMDDSSDKLAIPAGKPVSPTPAARINDSPLSSPDMRQQQQNVPSVGRAYDGA